MTSVYRKLCSEVSALKIKSPHTIQEQTRNFLPVKKKR
jgi:hypothetical protein